MDNERRLQALEIKVDTLTTSLSGTQHEFSAMRETVRIYVDMMDGLTDDIHDLKKGLNQHFIDEAADRNKMFIGLATATMSGLSTLGVLIWAVLQVLPALR
ncbi:hypothetical protein [Thiocystis violacea]|uniref:hypothetical protein n=1 Tax=Thiocystis violacea TaxID=13725 RepID=UPI0019036827|nr:hypothetical protein [Thiocystis violacea]MBK1719232.1 hypothetical protein [Thiocystis violacea]